MLKHVQDVSFIAVDTHQWTVNVLDTNRDTAIGACKHRDSTQEICHGLKNKLVFHHVPMVAGDVRTDTADTRA